MRLPGRVPRPAALLVLLGSLLLAGCGDDGNGESQDSAATGARYASASAQESEEAQPLDAGGKTVVDNGFRPERHGFGFENYGPGYQNLTPDELENLFGAPACAYRIGGACGLSPPGVAWMSQVNQWMDGGHCYGFSLTSLQMFEGKLSPLDYGGPTAPALPLFGNVTLQRRIAESWALQTLERTNQTKIAGAPSKVLDAIVESLRSQRDTVTIGLFKRDGTGGHAVTPYAVEDRGGGEFRVLIYDNNYPNIARAIDFDRRQETWRYYASPNPDQPTALYEGDATTPNNFLLFPTAPQLGVHPCPFCRPETTPGPPQKYEQVTLAGDSANHGHLVLRDERGRSSGFVDGRLRNQIPGVRVVPIATSQNWRVSPEPMFLVPRGLQYSITLDGGDLEAADNESVSVIGPGYSTVVSGIVLKPGESDRLVPAVGRRGISYRPGSGFAQSPRIELGFDRPTGALTFAVAAPEIRGASTLVATARPGARRLDVDARGVRNAGRYGVTITEVGRRGRERVRGRTLRVEPGGTATLRLRRR